MKLMFRTTDRLLGRIHSDLSRTHPYAAERVGFVACGVSALEPDGLAIYAASYHPVDDEDYVDDPSVGAMLGAAAFRKALQLAYNRSASIFHVHRHDHRGKPRPSRVDEAESRRFIPDFWKVCPDRPHGTIILSLTDAYGAVWLPGCKKIRPLDSFIVVGDAAVTVRSGIDEWA